MRAITPGRVGGAARARTRWALRSRRRRGRRPSPWRKQGAFCSSGRPLGPTASTAARRTWEQNGAEGCCNRALERSKSGARKACLGVCGSFLLWHVLFHVRPVRKSGDVGFSIFDSTPSSAPPPSLIKPLSSRGDMAVATMMAPGALAVTSAAGAGRPARAAGATGPSCALLTRRSCLPTRGASSSARPAWTARRAPVAVAASASAAAAPLPAAPAAAPGRCPPPPTTTRPIPLGERRFIVSIFSFCPPSPAGRLGIGGAEWKLAPF